MKCVRALFQTVGVAANMAALRKQQATGDGPLKDKDVPRQKRRLLPAVRTLSRSVNVPCACASLLSLSLLAVSCARTSAPDQAPSPAREDMTPMTASSQPFRIVAYATEGIAENQIPYDKLTQINYSFLIPNADGTFRPIKDASKLTNIVAAAHSHKVSVSIAIGGWGWDSQFEEMASGADTRAAFVRNVSRFVQEFHLDGVDVDWEYPDAGQSSQNFLALIRELRAALPGKTLTAAVVSYGDKNGLGIPRESFAEIDFVNVMTYDGPDHGSMEQFEKGLKYWSGRGVPKEKLIMGVPFYSRAKESPEQSVTYARLVAAVPAAANTDTCEFSGLTQRYNGIPTIKEKTRIAMQSAAGIMFWVLNADAPGDLSLVNAIHQTANSK